MKNKPRFSPIVPVSLGVVLAGLSLVLLGQSAPKPTSPAGGWSTTAVPDRMSTPNTMRTPGPQGTPGYRSTPSGMNPRETPGSRMTPPPATTPMR